jgi:glutathionylspermidine synthase
MVEGRKLDEVSGPYGDGPCIYQEFCPLIHNGENFAQLGVWMVGPDARGLGVREDVTPILRNTSRFVPHVIMADPSTSSG